MCARVSRVRIVGEIFLRFLCIAVVYLLDLYYYCFMRYDSRNTKDFFEILYRTRLKYFFIVFVAAVIVFVLLFLFLWKLL